MGHLGNSRSKNKEEKTLKLFEYLIKEQGDFLDKNRITDYVIYGPTSYSDAIILKIMESKNINIINLRPSPLNKQFCISKNMSNELYGLKENYQKIKEMGLSKEEQEQVSDIFQRYREKNYKPDCAVSFKESKIQKSSRYLKAGWKMLKSHYLPSISLLRMWSWGVIQKGYDHLDIFENPVEGEKFVLFPLHYQPEASTLIHGKWYHNQLTLIDNLIRSIPVGYKLYVKEHSHGYGNRNLKFFKEIKKYTNVRLISPHANNLDLIEKSSLVTTITGTSGWEAIMLQKPVVVFGDVFYGVFDCVKKIKNIEELPNAIRERLDKKTSSEEAITCLASMVKSTYPGLARLPGGCANQSLQEENIKLLASGIVQHIKHTTPIHQPLSP